MKLKLILSAALLATGVMAGNIASAQEKLNVWWVKGYYPQEDQALYDVIKKYEAKHKDVKIELSQYPIQDMIPKTVAALDSGAPPDIAYADVYDFQVLGKWAYDGKLEDVSSIIDPMRARFAPNTAETTFLLNNTTGKRAYYAIPMKQQTMHIQYWKDMLADAGFKESDIPKEWHAYWDFWCDKVQPALRTKTGKRIYGVGVPMGVDSTDSFFSFLTFADAYNVKMVNDSGKLLVDDPSVRTNLIAALKDYVSLYAKGCTPPSSTSWKDPDNNVAFHNKTTVLTHNASISIVAKWLDDMNNKELTQAQRDIAKQNYEKNIATTGFPNKPDGSKMVYRAAVKDALIFKQGKNVKRAKEFMAFFMQEENLTPYLENSLGRWFPATKAGQESKFWQQDPHRLDVYNQFKAGTVNFEMVKNYKFTILNNENIWAKAMNRVVNEKWTADHAIDEMIARIKQVAG